MKKLTALWLILGILVGLAGCSLRLPARYEDGWWASPFAGILPEYFMAVRAETDTFDIWQVELELFWGLYDMEFYAEKNRTAQDYIDTMGTDSFDYLVDAEVVFALYAAEDSDAVMSSAGLHDWEGDGIPDFRQVEGLYLLREIPAQEIVEGEYGYTTSFLGGIQYNHSETVRLPQELFQETADRDLELVLISWLQSPQEGKGCYMFGSSSLELDWDINNRGQVCIEFD